MMADWYQNCAISQILISQNERISVYPSRYLSQHHIDVKVINVGVKVIGWSIDPKVVRNKKILKYL